MRRRWLVVGIIASVFLAGTGLVTAMSRARVTGSTTEAVAGLASNSEPDSGWSVVAGAPAFVVAQQIENQGRLPLVVFGVGGQVDDPWFSVDATWVPTSTRAFGPDTRGRDLPLRLKSGEGAQLLVRYRLRKCLPFVPGSANVFESVIVNHRTLGLGGNTEVLFYEPVEATAEALARTPLCS